VRTFTASFLIDREREWEEKQSYTTDSEQTIPMFDKLENGFGIIDQCF